MEPSQNCTFLLFLGKYSTRKLFKVIAKYPQEAVVVGGIVGEELLDSFGVLRVLGAVVHAEGVTGEEQPRLRVEGEHGIGPMKVRGNHLGWPLRHSEKYS